MRLLLGSLAVVVVVVGGCGNGGDTSVDTKAWQAELHQQGIDVAHWQQYQDVFSGLCEDSTEDLGLFLTLQDAPDEAQMRTGFKYACPDKVLKLDDAYASTRDATSSVQEACDTPKDQRTDDQEQLAEAMGC